MASSAPSAPAELPHSDPINNGDEFDVVVIGSGLAGLTTAFRLSKDKVKVLVVESDVRFGGRTRSKNMAEVLANINPKTPKVSYGGTMVMLENGSTISLARELGFLPFQPELKPNAAPDAINVENMALNPWLIIALWIVGRSIAKSNEKLSKSLDPNALPKHHELDAEPLSDWLERKANPFCSHVARGSKQAVRDWFFQVENYPTDMSKISTFFAAEAIYKRLSNITPTGIALPQIMRWANGTGDFIDKIITAIRAHQGKVVSNHRAVNLHQNGDTADVTVQLQQGDSILYVKGKRVVVATSIPVASRLTYEPALPSHLQALGSMIQTWDDPAVQVVFAFETPFWRDRKIGMNAWPAPLIPDVEHDGLRVYGPVFDLSQRDSNRSSFYNGLIRILVQRSRISRDGVLWPEAEIRESALKYLNNLVTLGKGGDIDPELAKGQMWVFDFNTVEDVQAVTFYYKPTADHQYARTSRFFREPFGLIHFAGSERADRGFAWMEGGIRSGNLAAASILTQLHPGLGLHLGIVGFNERKYWRGIKKYKHYALIDLKIKDLFDVPRQIFTGVQLMSHLIKQTMIKVSQDLKHEDWRKFFKKIGEEYILREPGHRIIFKDYQTGAEKFNEETKEEKCIFDLFHECIRKDLDAEPVPSDAEVEKRCVIS